MQICITSLIAIKKKKAFLHWGKDAIPPPGAPFAAIPLQESSNCSLPSLLGWDL